MNVPFEKSRTRGYKGTAVIAILAILQWALMKYASPALPHRPLFAFFFFNMVLVPGFIVSRLIFPRLQFHMRGLLSFLFGISAIFLYLIIFALFRLDLFTLGIIIPALSIVINLTGNLIGPPVARGSGVEEDTPRVSGGVLIALGCLIIFASILILSHGDPMLYTSDSADHIAYIRRVSVSHEAFPENFLYKDGGLLTRDIRKGLMHSTWGAINLLTGNNDVSSVWPVISTITSIFTLLAFFCAGWMIFRSPAVGLLASLIFVFIYGGGLTQFRLITTAYSFPAGKIFSMVFLFSLIGFLKHKGNRFLVLLAVASFAATGTHIGHLILSAFIIFFVVGGKLIENPRGVRARIIKREAPLAAALTVAVNIPYLLMRYVRDYAPNNEIHSHLQGIFRVTENLYTVNPVMIYTQLGMIGILSVLSVFILWRQSRRDEELRLLLWGTIAIWAVVFNPFLIPILMRFISYLVLRFRAAVPAPLIIAALIKILWDRLRGRDVLISRKAAAAGWIAVILIFGYQLAVTPSGFAYGRKTPKELRRTCWNISDICAEINKYAPPGGVVASDPITSYCLPAYTDQFVICTFDQHSVPNDSTAVRRIRDCRDILSPLETIGRSARLLNKYGADYIVVNARIPDVVTSLYWNPDPGMARRSIERFSRYPSLFRPIYNTEDSAIFEITERMKRGDLPEEEEEPTRKVWGEPVPPDEMSKLTHSEYEGILIRSVKTGSESVARGGRLVLEIEWVAGGKVPYQNYMTHVRFDRPFEKGPLYAEWYGKIYRKIRERIRGGRYRFRAAHLPMNGVLTPDKWPVGRVVSDRFEVNIPKDIFPGEYTISVKLAVDTPYPNYDLRDLLRDDDYFDGPDMAKMRIE